MAAPQPNRRVSEPEPTSKRTTGNYKELSEGATSYMLLFINQIHNFEYDQFKQATTQCKGHTEDQLNSSVSYFVILKQFVSKEQPAKSEERYGRRNNQNYTNDTHHENTRRNCCNDKTVYFI
jgi:hypothetical protein